MKDPIPIIQSRHDLHRSLDSVYTERTTRPSLKAVCVLASISPEELVGVAKQEPRLERYRLALKPIDDDLYRLLVKKTMQKGHTIEGQVIIDDRHGEWIVLTTGGTYFTQHAVGHLLDLLYPEVNRIYLNHGSVIQLLNTVEGMYNGKRVLTQFSAFQEDFKRGKFLQKRSTIRGDEAEQDLRTLARRHRIWLQQVSFEIASPAGLRLLSAVITSGGLARLEYGAFSDYEKNLLIPLLKLGRQLQSSYSQARREVLKNSVDVRPYHLNYPEPFAQPYLKLLASKLSGRYTAALTHAGNPYLVAELLDPDDGSSFGLTALGSQITITPISTKSEGSLGRLVNWVESVLGETSVETPW